jgi:hypothetical protein
MMERGETMQEVLSKCRVEEVIQESAIEGTMKSIVIIEEASKSIEFRSGIVFLIRGHSWRDRRGRLVH